VDALLSICVHIKSTITLNARTFVVQIVEITAFYLDARGFGLSIWEQEGSRFTSLFWA
jgi:hypothetical protein